jgi:hypothetical protein
VRPTVPKNEENRCFVPPDLRTAVIHLREEDNSYVPPEVKLNSVKWTKVIFLLQLGHSLHSLKGTAVLFLQK